ncbi:MAG: polymer-forming cytoskeletal protein [Acetatifactor sp.]|nr:polymer-forming cytoskeletal protein [Acetatifactor sp.]
MMGKKETEISISTLIGKGTQIDGDFASPGSVRIDGDIDGSVTVGGTLILGAGGSVNGNVTAASVVIGGEVLGDITVQQKVELTGTAKVLGNIVTTVIVIDENAIFQGKCDMNQPVSDRKAKARAAKAVKASKKSAKAALAEALREVQEAESNELQEESARENTSGEAMQGQTSGSSENNS